MRSTPDYTNIMISSSQPYRTRAKNPKKKSLIRSALFWVPDVYYKDMSYEEVLLKGWLQRDNSYRDEIMFRAFVLANSTAKVIAQSDAIVGGTTRYIIHDNNDIRKIYKRIYKPKAKIFY